jgi:hypothetical protein
VGRPEADRAEAEMATGQLRVRIRADEREKAWAPDHVANQPAGTRQAADKHRHDATLWDAQAAAAIEQDAATRLRDEAARSAALAKALEDRACQLADADEVRAAWYAHTPKPVLPPNWPLPNSRPVRRTSALNHRPLRPRSGWQRTTPRHGPRIPTGQSLTTTTSTTWPTSAPVTSATLGLLSRRPGRQDRLPVTSDNKRPKRPTPTTAQPATAPQTRSGYRQPTKPPSPYAGRSARCGNSRTAEPTMHGAPTTKPATKPHAGRLTRRHQRPTPSSKRSGEPPKTPIMPPARRIRLGARRDAKPGRAVGVWASACIR